MRVAAYVLAADPEWLLESLTSYYGLVDRIVVCYDRNHLSWTGQPLDVGSCLAAIKAVDVDNKSTYLQGDFWRPEKKPLESDTLQRQVALDAASEDADWVIQLDADETLLNTNAFAAALRAAENAGRDGLEYPARLMYASLGDGRFLELSRRFWQIAANYPGPVAVRAGTELKIARQGIQWERLWRVDFRRRNTDPHHPQSVHVDDVVSPADAILHLSWARSIEGLRAKIRSSGHSNEYNHDSAIQTWEWRTRHPRLTVLTTPIRRRSKMDLGRTDGMRISRVDLPREGRPQPST